MNTFKKRFQHDWVLYLVVVLVAVLGWTWIFSVFHAPQSFETINVFFVGSVRDYGLEEFLKTQLQDCSVVDVKLYSGNPDDGAFAQKFSLVGLNGSDLLIVPRSVADKTQCNTCFVELPEQYRRKDCYLFNNVPYGIVLTSAQILALSDYLCFDEEDYILFVSAASVNAGENCLTNNAWIALEKLLSL